MSSVRRKRGITTGMSGESQSDAKEPVKRKKPGEMKLECEDREALLLSIRTAIGPDTAVRMLPDLVHLVVDFSMELSMMICDDNLRAAFCFRFDSTRFEYRCVWNGGDDAIITRIMNGFVNGAIIDIGGLPHPPSSHVVMSRAKRHQSGSRGHHQPIGEIHKLESSFDVKERSISFIITPITRESGAEHSKQWSPPAYTVPTDADFTRLSKPGWCCNPFIGVGRYLGIVSQNTEFEVSESGTNIANTVVALFDPLIGAWQERQLGKLEQIDFIAPSPSNSVILFGRNFGEPDPEDDYEVYHCEYEVYHCEFASHPETTPTHVVSKLPKFPESLLDDDFIAFDGNYVFASSAVPNDEPWTMRQLIWILPLPHSASPLPSAPLPSSSASSSSAACLAPATQSAVPAVQMPWSQLPDFVRPEGQIRIAVVAERVVIFGYTGAWTYPSACLSQSNQMITPTQWTSLRRM
jgi:hypothetical protein